MAGNIDQLIINKPYDEPVSHWRYERESRTFTKEPGRRSAGFIVATPGSKSFDDPGVFRELPLVNRIRPRVKAWLRPLDLGRVEVPVGSPGRRESRGVLRGRA